MPYTSNRKPSGLDTASSVGNDTIVIEQSGSVLKATVSQLEDRVFGAKTPITSPNGNEAVVVRTSTNLLREVAISNIVPSLNITDAKVAANAAIAGTKVSPNFGSQNIVTTGGTSTGTLTVSGSGNLVTGTLQVDGLLTANGGINATINGNANTASQLATARNIAATGDIAWNVNFNGSSNVTGTATIAADAVTSAKISDSSVIESKIASNAVTTAKIISAAVTTEKILDSSVTTSKIADNAVTTAKIPSDAVTTAKIPDDAITAAKLDGIASINQQTANYTLVLSDAGRVIEVNSGSSVTITVPTNATAAFATGATVVVTRRGAGDVVIAPASTLPNLRSADGRLKIGKQYAAVALVKIATDEWLVVGNLKA